MKRLLAGLLLLSAAGCTAPKTQPATPAPAPTPAPGPASAEEPLVSLTNTEVRLAGGFTAPLPKGTTPKGLSTLKLINLDPESAVIQFEECADGAPDSGCVGNHRAIKSEGIALVGGRPFRQFVADFQMPAASGDTRTWVEIHTIVAVPHGRRVDIIGRALPRDAERALRSAYQDLLAGFKTP